MAQEKKKIHFLLLLRKSLPGLFTRKAHRTNKPGEETSEQVRIHMQASRLATRTQSIPPTQVCCIASSASILTKRGAGKNKNYIIPVISL